MKINTIPKHLVESLKPEQKGERVNEKLMKISKQFESLFVNQLVGEMRKTVTHGGLVPESQGEKIYQSMLDYEYSQKIADTGQLGLSRLIYDSLLRKTRGE